MNRIYEGDCVEMLKQIDDSSIDLVLTDPPYFNQGARPRYKDQHGSYINTDFGEWDKFENDTQYIEWINGLIKEWIRVLNENGSVWMFCNDRYNTTFRDLAKFGATIVWHKNNAPPRFIDEGRPIDTGRRFIGMEINHEFCEMANKRIGNHQVFTARKLENFYDGDAL